MKMFYGKKKTHLVSKFYLYDSNLPYYIMSQLKEIKIYCEY
jgi:hypothetical protein